MVMMMEQSPHVPLISVHTEGALSVGSLALHMPNLAVSSTSHHSLASSNNNQKERRKQHQRGGAIPSSFPLKPARRAHNSNRLIHDPLANSEVVIDPSLDFLVLGNLVRVHAGAVKVPVRTHTSHKWGRVRRGGGRVSLSFSLSRMFGLNM